MVDLAIIKHFEGCFLKAYLDPIKIPTIGYGIIRYPDGTKVKMGDVITQERADELLEHEAAERLAQMKIDHLEPHQQSAMLSFQFNLGQAAWKNSTLRRVVMNHPKDYAAVKAQLIKWNRAGGKVLTGLTRRRKSEGHLYETGELKFNF